MLSIRETIQPSGARAGLYKSQKSRGWRRRRREKGKKGAEHKVIVAGMDGHTSKAVEKAKVMWEWREHGWMVHQGHLSEHDCAGSARREASAK